MNGYVLFKVGRDVVSSVLLLFVRTHISVVTLVGKGSVINVSTRTCLDVTMS